MKYNCELCNYLTEDRTAYYQHKKTKKHQEKVTNQPISSKNLPKTPITSETSESEVDVILKCKFCNLIFTRADNLSRHLKKTCMKNEINEIKIGSVLKEKELIEKQLEEVKKEKEERIKEKDKQLEDLKKEKEEEKKKLEEQLLYYRDVAYNKTDNDCNMTNLNFLNKHFADAPALEGPKDIHKLFNADKTENPHIYYAKLASELGSHHRLNILHKVISDFIVKDYCKEDKTKQSVWNSDSSRLNYIIKECIQKDKIWIMDKSGQSLLKKVINPIIEYIKPELAEATKRILSYSAKPNGITFMDMKDHQALLEIGNNIMNNSLQEDILKELTGHFNINQKLLLKDIKEKKKETNDVKAIEDVVTPKLAIQDIKNEDVNDDMISKEKQGKEKLINQIKDIDNKLDKLRKDYNKLDFNSESDEEEENKRRDKLNKIEIKKKELKEKKKELTKFLTEYNELDKKEIEIDKEEEDISNDTESEDEKEKERQLAISKISRTRKFIKYKKTELDKQINKII